MTDYKKPYLLLFNAITDAAEHLLRCENIAALKPSPTHRLKQRS